MKDELLELAGIVNLLEQKTIENKNQVSWLKLKLDKLIEKVDNEEIANKEFFKNLNITDHGYVEKYLKGNF